jgi:demethylmenaquinone methyltransferase/2-methoxy-6-polyprenyl-1,4-benzoquinol methylase/phosphoethanolamine N-methyltransferase
MLHRIHGHQDRAAGPATRGVTIRWAHSYDRVTALLMLGQEPKFRSMTVDLAAVQPGERVLEVGCGTGSLALAAARRTDSTGKVYGIDPDPRMIATARDKAARAGLDAEFEVGLIEKLPFDAGEFDVVLSSLMLHHLPGDLQVLGLAEVRRVLKPGGRFLAVDIEPPTGPHARKLLTHLLGERMIQGGLKDLEPVLAAAGFTRTESGHTPMRLLSYLRGWV